jgi:copper(I)-binding protein
MNMWHRLFGVFIIVLANTAWAGVNDVVVDRVWVGETIPGQKSATLELNITTIAPARLVTLSSPETDRIEIHEVSQHHGKMHGVVVGSMRLPAHKTITFGSNRLFLIMEGIRKEFNVGDRIPVKVVVEYANHRKQTLAVVAEVKKMALSYQHLKPGEVYDHR